jgi:hypothetical protein
VFVTVERVSLSCEIHEVQPRRSRPFLTAIAPRRSRA